MDLEDLRRNTNYSGTLVKADKYGLIFFRDLLSETRQTMVFKARSIVVRRCIRAEPNVALRYM